MKRKRPKRTIVIEKYPNKKLRFKMSFDRMIRENFGYTKDYVLNPDE